MLDVSRMTIIGSAMVVKIYDITLKSATRYLSYLLQRFPIR